MQRRKLLSVILTVTLFLMGLFPNGITVYAASDINDNIFDLSAGDIIISKGTTEGVLQIKQDANETRISRERPIIITGTTTEHTIKVDEATANITLDTVSINVSQLSQERAFQLVNHANVTLTLKENTQNTISSGFMSAGIEVSAGQSLTIQGGGELFAKGGGQVAGIGGSSHQDGGSITIKGGEVVATGGDFGAGIGSGKAFDDASNMEPNMETNRMNAVASVGQITIEGGRVKATGGKGGAGIGRGATHNTSTEYVSYAREEETGIETDTVRHKGVEVTITGVAQVKAVSTGVKSAIEPGGANSNIGTAVLVADILVQPANAEVILNNTNSSEMIHFKPAYGYSSIAFTVTPHNTYELQVAGKTEKTIFNVRGKDGYNTEEGGVMLGQ